MSNYPADAVIVSQDALDSEEQYDLILSNVTFVNALMEEHIRPDEMAPQAQQSYWVDYFMAQMQNGGFSQFVYNSEWDPFVIDNVVTGLEQMGARQHLDALQAASKKLDELGPEGLEEYFESDYFGENDERDLLNEANEIIDQACETENLIELNSNWLKSLPNLVAVSQEEMEAEVQRRAAALPDREQRIQEALDNAPRFEKIILALCEAQGHTLDRITAGDPAHEYEGENILAWHFLTDQGHHYMLEVNGKGMMFNGDTEECIREIEAGPEYGEE